MVLQRDFMSSASGPVNNLDSTRLSNGTTSPSVWGTGFLLISAGVVSSILLRGSFKFFIMTSKYFKEKSSIVDEGLPQLLCRRVTPLMLRDQFSCIAVFTSMVWICRGNIC